MGFFIVFVESAYKPGSVVDNHSSRLKITLKLKQPTRFRCGPHHKEPYLVLLRVEFTLQPTVTSGPVRSYRTLSPLPTEVGGLLSAALVVGSRLPAVSWHPALWSPDFPPLYPYIRRYNDKAAIIWLTQGAIIRILTSAASFISAPAKPFILNQRNCGDFKTSSTRLFCCIFDSVSFAAFGATGPTPTGVKRCLSIL